MALTFGVVSSLHCLGMCAPLQLLVMGQWLKGSKQQAWVIYHLGRVSTYVLLGIFAALIGNAFGLPNLQSGFTIVVGVVLISGYFGLKALKWDGHFYQFLSPVLIRVQSKLKHRKRSPVLHFISGGINGLLPCGMVYAALVPAITSPTLGQGALYMLAFGMGTVPMLFAANLLANKLKFNLGRYANQLIPITIIFIGSLLILRGMELGIPFISPEAPLANATQAEGCH